MALKGVKNPCAGNETFTLGYTVGELELLEELKREARLAREDTVSHDQPSAGLIALDIGRLELQKRMEQLY